jgi:hypothetical protein
MMESDGSPKPSARETRKEPARPSGERPAWRSERERAEPGLFGTSHLKMMRFLKKHRNPPRKPVPPENPAHQITNIGAECGRDPEGEYYSRKISERTGR